MEMLVKWKNGEIVILEGSDIAEAFNLAGYTKEDISAIEHYYECHRPTPENPDFPIADFNCPKCQGFMILHSTIEKKYSHKYNVHQYICEHCQHEAPKASTELRAKIAMNLFFCNHIIPSISEINKTQKEFLQLKEDEMADEYPSFH